MAQKNDFKIGQNLYTIYNGVKACPIIKVGFKYLTVKLNSWEVKVNLSNLIQEVDYGSAKQFYLTEQEILDKVERDDLIRKLSKHFDLWGKCRNNSLEQLRKISEILGL
jgi:hypothetical protein